MTAIIKSFPDESSKWSQVPWRKEQFYINFVSLWLAQCLMHNRYLIDIGYTELSYTGERYHKI